jgi:uncharacterized repeat protein (TIGR01451 family)
VFPNSSNQTKITIYRYCCAVAIGIIGHDFCRLPPVSAQVAPPGTAITNQATGSFIDSADDSVKDLESNVVSVTMAEVAGITISDPTISDPLATVIGSSAAPFQGISGVNQNDILYFDFVITNTGNDPTQFFIPGQPFQVNNGVFDRTQYGAVQIIEVKNGAGAVVPLPNNVSKIDIPAAGANTGDLGILGIPGGAIPANGSVKVRIPIKVTGNSGANVQVSLGDTGLNDNSAETVSQIYTVSDTLGIDVHTKDNINNNDPLNSLVSGEVDGLPAGGEKEASRYGEISIVAPPQIWGFKSAKLVIDRNNDNKINPGETVVWTIDYLNTGEVDIAGFQITDILPIGVNKSGAVTISTAGNQTVVPVINSDYVGNSITLDTTDNLFKDPIILKAGGLIKITIPVVVNNGVVGKLFNQAMAKADNLPASGVFTDNISQPSDLPPDLQPNIVIPNSSVEQTITGLVDPTSITVISNPQVLLVKRITAINGSVMTCDGINLANYEDDPANPYDDNDNAPPTTTYPQLATNKWPATVSHTSSEFLLGAINGGNIKPKDSIEYTIYFLSTGDSTANNVLLCDRVPSNVTFIPTAFNNYIDKSAGSVNESRGILALINGVKASYTNVDDGDAVRYFPPGSDPKNVYPKINCGGKNDNGAVVINLGGLPNATAPATPAGSYGFVRFQGQVK